jgi:hypothetical protein
VNRILIAAAQLKTLGCIARSRESGHHMTNEQGLTEIEARYAANPTWQWFNRTSHAYWRFAGRVAGYFPQALGRVRSTNPFVGIARLTFVFVAGFLIVPPLYLVLGPLVQIVLVIIAVIWTCMAGVFGWNRPTAQLAEPIAREERLHMTGKHLISIPRVQSRAPNKNTIEWKIPGKVSVGFMLVDRAGYFVFMKIRVEKKHWWNRSWKTCTAKSHDPAEAVINALDILETHGFYIDRDTIQFGEKIGDPAYFKKLGL